MHIAHTGAQNSTDDKDLTISFGRGKHCYWFLTLLSEISYMLITETVITVVMAATFSKSLLLTVDPKGCSSTPIESDLSQQDVWWGEGSLCSSQSLKDPN